MKRREVIAAAASLGGLGFAGCLSRSGGDGDDVQNGDGEDGNGDDGDGGQTGGTTGSPESLEGRLRVATYDSFVDAPSSSPGPWIKKEFERRHPDVTLEWVTPKNGINEYILRQRNDASFDADAYVGLKVPELVRVNRELSVPLFEPVRTDRLSNYGAIRSGYSFDPNDRVLPVFTGYCCFVYNDYEADAPETVDDLTTPAFEDKLTVQNAQTDNTGLYVLLWTVKVKGENGYLDYWQALVDNGLTVLDSWGETYEAFTSGDAAVITSYSNDQVYAQRSDADLKKHQVAFPGGHGYTNLSGIGKFAASDQTALTEAFVDFMLGPDAQGTLAELNVSFPVTDHGSVPPVFEEYAKEPPDPLLYSYDELVGKVGTWREDWAKTVAGS
jgi:thiamine transport system substrate-binding protein